MAETTEIIKTYAPIAAPFVASIVATFVTPKLERLSKFLKKNKAESIISVEAKFKDYLESSYEEHSNIPLLIFPNQKRRIQDIYIPLVLTSKWQRKPIVIDKHETAFLSAFKKILLVDTAGMGKSTILKRLFLSCIEKSEGIPIFIELRKLKNNESIVNFILKQLNPIDDDFDEDFVRRLIKDGNFIFLLDGYDEIPFNQREAISSNLHDFITKAENNVFIISSRPETATKSYSSFFEFKIQPLRLEESFKLLKKYDNGGKISTEIISKLEGTLLENVKDFLTNPLLVSLLYKSYEYKPNIPVKKHHFYRQVYDALFENHDLTKEGGYIRPKYSQLDSDSFHTILRTLGFITIKHGIEYDKDEILSYLKQANRQHSTIEFKESEFLKDLLQTVPLFTNDGNFFKWSHKSLQDYFAAQFIWLDTGERKAEILKKIVRSEEKEKFWNVLDLFYDIDYKAFRQIIVYDFLAEFSSHLNSSFPFIVKAHRMGTEIEDLRIQTFGKLFFLFPQNSMVKISDFFDTSEERYTLKHANRILSFVGEYLEEELRKYRYFGKASHGTAYSYLSFGNHNFFMTKFLYTKKLNLFYEAADYENIRSRNLKPSLNIPLDFCIILSENSYYKHISQSGLPAINFMLVIDSKDEETYCLLHPDKCNNLKEVIKLEIEKEESNDLFNDL